jgi:hypothetical protein
LLVDLGRANQPWVTISEYAQRYQSNQILDFLREKSYEHRVARLPEYLPRLIPGFRLPEKIAEIEDYFQKGIYGQELAQHLLLYYNIQSLDIVQMSRMPEDVKAFLDVLQPRQPRTQEEVQRFIGELSHLPAREWELTNTRYLLGTAPLLDLLNGVFDPGKRRFRIVERFEMVPKPGITNPTKIAEQTAMVSTNGTFAIFEFTGALPRAKLYSNWEVNTNAEANLKRIASPEFDPAKSVVITEQIPPPSAATATNENAGTVEFASYDPNHIVLKANANAPSILLLNDRFDPNWKVTVDGKPVTLLRANFLMRGVQLESGAHTVEYRFAPPVKLFYVSLTAIALGLGLLGFLAVSNRREEVVETKPEEPKPIAKPAAQPAVKK